MVSVSCFKFLLTYLHGLYFQREVANEGETGKVYRASFRDRSGRTVLILRPGMQVLSVVNSYS